MDVGKSSTEEDFSMQPRNSEAALDEACTNRILLNYEAPNDIVIRDETSDIHVPGEEPFKREPATSVAASSQINRKNEVIVGAALQSASRARNDSLQKKTPRKDLDDYIEKMKKTDASAEHFSKLVDWYIRPITNEARGMDNRIGHRLDINRPSPFNKSPSQIPQPETGTSAATSTSPSE
ncbi:hypothetical protein FRC01_008090, partial [Tulasnella sp. 417]